MKKRIGHISITDKVVFVYYEKEKPNPKSDFYFDFATPELSSPFVKEMEAYNASKREVEVENVTTIWDSHLKNKVINRSFYSDSQGGEIKVKHNQPCEAEVNGKAEITKIL